MARRNGVHLDRELLLVLIVEDDAMIAFGLEDVIHDAGYATALAASATQARDLVSFADPAVAVVDLRLQDGMTGPALARDLSERGVPVIVVSGDVGGDAAAGLTAVAYISKPAAPETVLDHIRSALDSDHAD